MYRIVGNNVQMKATNPYISNLLLTILPTWVSVTINFSSAMGPDMSTRCCWRPLKCDIFVIHRANIASCLWTAKKVQLEYNKDQVDLCPGEHLDRDEDKKSDHDHDEFDHDHYDDDDHHWRLDTPTTVEL